MSPDARDPEEYFAAVAAAHPRCFWLDGGGAREWSGSRSIIGALTEGDVSLTYHAGVGGAPGRVLRHTLGSVGWRSENVGSDIFRALADEMAAHPTDARGQASQWFGFFGYASRGDLPARGDARVDDGTGGAGLPDAVWMRPSVVRLFEHPVAAETPPTPAAPAAGDVPGEYAEAFERVQEALHGGHSYEVNLTHRVTTHADVDPVVAHQRLRRLNPAPYAGFLQHDVPGAKAWLLSSSPERYAVVGADRTIQTKPIKGTTPRGATPVEDAEHRERLAADPKFRSENLMIVDLLRNDLSMVCEPGTVEVPSLMEVESYASVHQLVSTVTGRLRDGVGTLDALRALFPAGSMTGAAKLRTMEIIDAVEATPRGAYAGAFGWIAADGRADLGVVIRSLMTTGDGAWTLGTGGGITVRSDVTEEWAEAQWKAERLLRVLAD